MKAKDKHTLFICQICESSLKVIKCRPFNKSRVEFAAFEVELIPADIDDKGLSEKLGRIFKKLGYRLNPVIVSMPRGLATCRYLKIPASTLEEIENISYLQAPRYLPYPADELVTAFQKISTDEAGFSHINLIIVHKASIERYLKIFNELKAPSVGILLSSYGLRNLYDFIRPDDDGTVIIADIDYEQAELAIVSSKKLLFSRSFKLIRTNPGWINLLCDEIKRTQDVFLKEISQLGPGKIAFFDSANSLEGSSGTLKEKLAYPAEFLSFAGQVNLAADLPQSALGVKHSPASLIGLGLAGLDESLNILPRDIKGRLKIKSHGRKNLRMALLISAILFLLGLGIAKDLDNKQRYLGQLKAKLQETAKEAAPLEDIEKRMRFLEKRMVSKPSALDILYELHQVVPDSVSLTSVNYEGAKEISLRGQSTQLNSVFSFVQRLEKSALLKGFNIKVRYASGKKVQAGEIIDFEIDCQKK